MNNNISSNPASVADIDIRDYAYDYQTGHPAVYVGTYAKYNNGSIDGMWLDLTTFSDYNEFMDACRALHSDEADPEFMFQDYENFPMQWYDEGSLSEATFERILKFAELDSDKQDAFEAFMQITCDDDADFDDFEERFEGEYSSEEEFAEYLVEECGMLDNIPDNIQRYFDYEAYARDLFITDYTMVDGYVFRSW